MKLDPVAKYLIIFGGVLLIGGLLWQLGWPQHLRLGRLPGDIVIEKENVKVYIPITTGILLSLFLSLITWFFRR
jgi:hypothetical protein